MAHFHIKTKKGRPYLYVREIARVHGKPTVISQVYLGSPERLVELARQTSAAGELKLKAEEFGALWIASIINTDLDIVSIIDQVVPRHPPKPAPRLANTSSMCIWNRMIHPVSKNKLSTWYSHTAIQHIRPVDIHELTSQRYWEKWDRVSEKHIERIALLFFERLWQIEKPESDCMLFDTTNYYTFMASQTRSALAARGKNKELEEQGEMDERVIAYRTSGEYWGKERSVIITFNPASARKQNYTFDGKLDALREDLLEMRKKARQQAVQWRDQEKIRTRYLQKCEQLHIASNYYTIEFNDKGSTASMSFSKNVYQVEKKRQCFGKNVILTDNTDWSTVDIVQASLDRWEVENQFRVSKNDDCVAVSPFRHWTDGKIRCHLFSCVVAMTNLRRLELRLSKKGISRTAESIMEEMSRLHSIMVMRDGRSEPVRKLEQPAKNHAEVLSAFGYRIDAGGVLQPLP